MDNVLTICQEALAEIGFDTPSFLVGNTDDTAVQIFALANRVGKDIARAHEWSALTIEGATISLVTSQESYALPADFLSLVEGTQWDRTNKWRTMGPDDAQTARWRRESIESQNGPRRAVRQAGSAITIWPIPLTTGDLIAFDYVSTYWAASAGGTKQARFVADTDVPILDDNLFVLGLKWRWMAAKGMEATALKLEFNGELAKAVAKDKGGGQVVNMGEPYDPSSVDDENCSGVIPAPVVSLPTS